MATIRSLPAAPLDAPSSSPNGARHRLRAVGRDEVIDVAEFLPPGATWLPAPQHTLPTLPGQPPMVGYLVLIPADRPHIAESAFPDATDDALVRIDSVQRTAEVDGR